MYDMSPHTSVCYLLCAAGDIDFVLHPDHHVETSYYSDVDAHVQCGSIETTPYPRGHLRFPTPRDTFETQQAEKKHIETHDRSHF